MTERQSCALLRKYFKSELDEVYSVIKTFHNGKYMLSQILDPAATASAGMKPSTVPSMARGTTGKEGYNQLLGFLSMGGLPRENEFLVQQTQLLDTECGVESGTGNNPREAGRINLERVKYECIRAELSAMYEKR